MLKVARTLVIIGLIVGGLAGIYHFGGWKYTIIIPAGFIGFYNLYGLLFRFVQRRRAHRQILASITFGPPPPPGVVPPPARQTGVDWPFVLKLCAFILLLLVIGLIIPVGLYFGSTVVSNLPWRWIGWGVGGLVVAILISWLLYKFWGPITAPGARRPRKWILGTLGLIAAGALLYFWAYPKGYAFLVRRERAKIAEERLAKKHQADSLVNLAKLRRQAIILPPRDTSFVLEVGNKPSRTYRVPRNFCEHSDPVVMTDSYVLISQLGRFPIIASEPMVITGRVEEFAFEALGAPSTKVIVDVYPASKGVCEAPPRLRQTPVTKS